MIMKQLELPLKFKPTINETEVNTSFAFDCVNKVSIQEVHEDRNSYEAGCNDSVRYLITVTQDGTELDDLSREEFYEKLCYLVKTKSTFEDLYNL